jgi:hypothetical protein
MIRVLHGSREAAPGQELARRERLHKAAELLPNPIVERSSDLELALRACDQLGSVVLNPSGEG